MNEAIFLIIGIIIGATISIFYERILIIFRRKVEQGEFVETTKFIKSHLPKRMATIIELKSAEDILMDIINKEKENV